MQISTGWAWQLEDGTLCRWAEPTRESLMAGDIPSPDAKPVCVRMLLCGDYARLKALEAGQQRPTNQVRRKAKS